jgi:hypothetical protein
LLDDLKKIEKASQQSKNSPEKGGRQTPVTQASTRCFQFTNLSPRSLAQLQSIVPCARNMGVHMQLSTHWAVISMKKIVSLRKVLEKASVEAQPPIKRLPACSCISW